mmetsp:Transcript_45083/g.96732  ORF Transcript_45083/g.96732 Transcript_45083/m.96732 type:complete len:260 (+) Transcript_45083:104-883(+)
MPSGLFSTAVLAGSGDHQPISVSFTDADAQSDISLGGSTHVPVVDKVLKKMDDFNKAFSNLAEGGQVPAPVTEGWTQLYEQRDPLNKVKDFMDQCHKQEKALVGPRPEDSGDPTAQEDMENSISELANRVAQQSNEMVSLCDKAQNEMAGDEGMAEHVARLIEKLKLARTKILSMTTDELPKDPVVGDEGKVAQSSLLMPPEALEIFLRTLPTAGTGVEEGRQVQFSRPNRPTQRRQRFVDCQGGSPRPSRSAVLSPFL